MTDTTLADNIEALAKAADAWNAFVKARAAMNAAIPDAIHATPADRALYDERYRADHEAERVHWRTAIELAQHSPTILRALRERDQAVEALKTTNAWLDRWARHIGDCPGIDDCTCGLTRVRYEAETTLASMEGTGHE